MDLRPLLRDIRRPQDLRRLIAIWGHQPAWHHLPPQQGRGSPASRTAPVVVGQYGEFLWLGVSGDHPERAARTLARAWAARGRLAGVLGLDPVRRRLAVAIALDDAPALAIDLADPDPVALGCLAKLAGGPDGSLAYAARAAESLAGQSVGRRFFAEFRATLERMAAALPGPMRGDDRRAYALLQLTRVLFLYFVQAKGWLDRRERFLAEAVDRCLSRRRRLHRDLLRPLFFGTLNRPAAERRSTAAAFGAIPFLNGGLFEPHPIERRLNGDVPNDVWRDAFDGLFERFHFTVTEGSADGRVAPDMLGRVFEGVMAPDARRASGTYYTPASLVRAVLDAALASHLAGRLRCSEPEAERRLLERDTATRAALRDIRVLDPAVGSGAFLLGALERLAGPSSSERRAVLRQSLFGVDRAAAAVRLTELRLWLAVIADDPADRPCLVRPLPNLDCLIRQGDSLFAPVGEGRRLRPVEPELAARLAHARREVVGASGSGKSALVRRLGALEVLACDRSLAAEETDLAGEVAALLREARGDDLFGHRRGLDHAARARLASLRGELHQLRRARRLVAREGEVPWFHYECHFADVFARGGFDLVAGNPPWLRAEEVPAELGRRLAGRYRWWKAAGRRPGSNGGYGHRPDLSVAFLERALELAAPGGVVAFVVPAKLATAGYGAAARHALAASTTLIRVADLSGRSEAAFDATVYPLAIVARKTPAPPGHRVRSGLAAGIAPTVLQNQLRGGTPWVLSREPLRAALAGMEQEHPKLASLVTCHLGLKTGANRIFLDPPPWIEPALLRIALRGRDIRPFRVEGGRRLLFTHDGAGMPCRSLPPLAAAYLRRHRDALRARADWAGGVEWAVFRVRPATASHRVVWSDLARELAAVWLTGPEDAYSIPLNTCYVAAMPDRSAAACLAAWLNSSWSRAAALAGAVPAAGGFARFSAGTVGRVPLVSAALADPTLVAIAEAGRRGEPIQGHLDDVTAAHLGLSGGARKALLRSLSGRAANRG